MNSAYKASGVDVEAGYRSVELIKSHVNSTMRPEVLSKLGGFGGMFSMAKAKEMEEPILVSGTDGVGTKLKIAFLTDKHDTVGIDCVAMCVNDIVCSGAEPLFFLDYIALDKNIPEKVADIVAGVAEGCRLAGCALVGGETAEMPGLYGAGEYDIAGFAVGIVDKKDMVDGSKIKDGDLLIGIASGGLHSNGYSLVRRLLRPSENNIREKIETIGMALGDELLKPTRIYVKTILSLMKKAEIKGISNITGGGFIENIPRMFQKGMMPVINKGSWPVLPVFKYLQQSGNITDEDMFNTFNMGIGMVLCVSPEDEAKVHQELQNLGEKSYTIGYVKHGEGIEIC